MSKHTRISLVTAGGAGLVLVTAGPAAAVDYIGPAVAALSSTNVYVDSSTSLSSAKDISSSLSGEGVAVVALPYDATATYNANTLASNIQSQVTGYDTVVVVVDGTQFGVASTGDSAAIIEALYTNMSGDAGAAILASQEVLVTGGEKTVSEVGHNSNSEADGSALVGVGGGLLGVLVLAAAGVFIAKKLKGDGSKPILDPKLMESLPIELRKTLENLARLGSLYRSEGEAIIADHVSNILTHSRELFTRVKRKAGEGQYNMAVVKYTDTLKKLNAALGEDYYYDILKNPQLWSDASNRKQEVLAAVKATDAQIIRNIQQVNANEDLEIKVALESLSRSMETPALERLYDNPN